MRSLSATLEAAQKKHIGEPVAQVVIDDRHIGAARPRWSLLVNQPGVPDGPVAVGGAYDGALMRARVDAGAGALYVQRVSDPSDTGQWSNWTLLGHDVAGDGQIALAWDGNTIQALFYVAADGRTIRLRQSDDNGQTWSSAETVVSLADGHVCRSLAASLNAGYETLYCLFGDETAQGETTLYSTQRAEAGGGWSSPQSWGRAAASACYGLAVDGRGSQLNVAACLDNSLWAFVVALVGLGDWPAPYELLHSDTAAVSYRWPSIAVGLGQHYLLFFVERRAGGDRLHHLFSAAWQEFGLFPRPHQALAGCGAGVTSDLSYHYLCTSRSVYRAQRWQGSAAQRLDVSADMRTVTVNEQVDRPGRLLLTLRNDDGRYSSAGAGGQPILPGSQVSLRLGYRTSAGEDVSYLRPYWLTQIAFERQAGGAVLRLTALDGWGMLERARARQSYLWTQQSLQAILTALLAGLGFHVTTDGAAAWQRQAARFAVSPGMSLGEAVRELLRQAGGHVIFCSDAAWEATWPSAIAHLSVGEGTSTYSYGGEHPLIAGEHATNEQPCTHVVVLGEGETMAEAIDWDAIDLGNEDRVRLVIDRRLSDPAAATLRAEGELAAWQRAAASAWLLVPPNVGQEMLDVVTISDAALGLNGAQRRVVGSEITLDRARGLFQQRLELAAVQQL